MSEQKQKRAAFLSDVSEWRWDDFVRAEIDNAYSTNESVVFSLVRACAMEDLKAMKTAIGRLDGKLVTPVRFQMPKIYRLYPNAKSVMPVIQGPEDEKKAIVIATPEEMAPPLPTKGFRETMDRMGDYPRETPKTIIEAQEQIEKHVRNQGRLPIMVPRVKSVVVAHLLKMAQDRDMDAINEVFDQLDGKLVETVQIVGADMYFVEFDEIAPPGAYLNDEGVYQIRDVRAEKMWHTKLMPAKVGKPIIIEP